MAAYERHRIGRCVSKVPLDLESRQSPQWGVIVVQIAVTVCDVESIIQVGGDAERRTAIITLRDEQIPPILREYLSKKSEVGEWNETNKIPKWFYQTVSFSMVEASAAPTAASDEE